MAPPLQHNPATQRPRITFDKERSGRPERLGAGPALAEILQQLGIVVLAAMWVADTSMAIVQVGSNKCVNKNKQIWLIIMVNKILIIIDNYG